MSSVIDVAIIGAGPYGLSIAAHLDAAGVEYRIFGAPMEAWQHHMPSGMRLKSYGESSNLFDPQMSYTLEDFCREKRIDYHPTMISVELETFIAYGKAFQERFAPRVERKQLIALTPTYRGHELHFDNGETVTAKRVVIGVGITPFKRTPPSLAHLPPPLMTHSSDHGLLNSLDGREITIVGSGSSALDIAALASMRGATVTIVSRSPEAHFQNPPDPTPSLLHQALFPTANGLGGGWLLRFYGDAPQLVHLLPDRVRGAILKKTLGPSGGYFIRDQIAQKVTLKLGREIEAAEERGDRVRLTTIAKDGTRETIESDHLVAATGYRVDVGRLAFLAENTRRNLRTVNDTPVLSSDFESSERGLYFVGVASARSFGPVMRFVVGAIYPARRLSRILQQNLLRRPISVSTTLPN